MTSMEIVRTIWPLILIQLIVQVFAIVDVARKKKTKNLSVPIWIVIIILGEVIGAIVYYLVGRAEE